MEASSTLVSRMAFYKHSYVSCHSQINAESEARYVQLDEGAKKSFY